MSDAKEKVIIRRAIVDSEDEHHGGAWKVAYADFMTAMMAFFLLLWMLSNTEEKKLEGLADYFTPTLEQGSGEGGLGAFAGLAPETRGILASRIKEQPTGENEPVASPNGSAQNPWMDLEATDPSNPAAQADDMPVQPLYAPGADAEPTFAERQNGLPGDGDRVHLGDSAALQTMADQITQSLEVDPTLADMAESVRVELRDTGLEMHILDQADLPMFPSGSAQFTEKVDALVARVGAAISPLPNRIVITGHTDAAPFTRPDYTNWELSTDRAHATRRSLIDAGVNADRFVRVSGMADQEPLLPTDPMHPSNRRISIHLILDEVIETSDLP